MTLLDEVQDHIRVCQVGRSHTVSPAISVAAVEPTTLVRGSMRKRTPQRTEELPVRLRQAIESYGSVTAMAAAMDRSEGALRKWLLGKAEPNASDLRAISQLTGVSVEWLIFGGASRYSAAALMRFLGHSLHRQDCVRLSSPCVSWAQLNDERRKQLTQLAHEQVAHWLIAEGVTPGHAGARIDRWW